MSLDDGDAGVFCLSGVAVASLECVGMVLLLLKPCVQCAKLCPISGWHGCCMHG
jgi:hypothetical protein